MLSKQDLRQELQISDVELAAATLRDAIANLDAIERELSVAEQRVWQPHWSKDDPLPERLRRIGVTDATADFVVCLIRGWEAFSRGEPFPADTNALLDMQEASEVSANAQLAAIVKARAARKV